MDGDFEKDVVESLQVNNSTKTSIRSNSVIVQNASKAEGRSEIVHLPEFVRLTKIGGSFHETVSRVIRLSSYIVSFFRF